jgi:hypothetical protein
MPPSQNRRQVHAATPELLEDDDLGLEALIGE